jgi:hypothetical protein
LHAYPVGDAEKQEGPMPIKYTYDASCGLIRTVVTGHVTPSEITDYFRSVSKESYFPAPSLTDARQALPDMRGDEIRSIANSFRALASTMRDSPIAVIVSSDLAFGLVRMLGLFLDDAAVIHPFRDAERAMEWLTSSVSARNASESC